MYNLLFERKPTCQKLLALDKGYSKNSNGSFIHVNSFPWTGANPVTENEFKLFQRAMSEQGLSHSSTAEIIAKASSNKGSNMDAWG